MRSYKKTIRVLTYILLTAPLTLLKSAILKIYRPYFRGILSHFSSSSWFNTSLQTEAFPTPFKYRLFITAAETSFSCNPKNTSPVLLNQAAVVPGTGSSHPIQLWDRNVSLELASRALCGCRFKDNLWDKFWETMLRHPSAMFTLLEDIFHGHFNILHQFLELPNSLEETDPYDLFTPPL